MLEGLSPIPIENFGGLVTLPELADLARGMSPDCQNVIFLPGQVRTREGLTVPFTASSVKFNSIAKYTTPGFVNRIMAFGSNGTLYKENPAGTLAVVRSGLVADSYMISDTLFGRHYCAFYNGRVGGDIPLSFDDANVHRVSPEGPAAGPSLADESQTGHQTGQDADQELTGADTGNIAQSFQVAADSEIYSLELWMKKLGTPFGQMSVQIETNSSGVPSGTILGSSSSEAVSASQLGTDYGWVEFSFLEPVKVTASTTYWIVLGGEAGYDTAYVSATTAAVWGIADTGSYTGGNLATYAASAWTDVTAKDALFRLTTGLVPEGKHKAICWFQTKTGYWTKCSPPVSWEAAGEKAVEVTDIPTGPDWVAKRLLAFTSAGGESYYHIPSKMALDDNTTTSLTVDFSDEELLTSELADYLFRLRQVSKPLGVFATVNRLLWWSPRALMTSWRNIGFDGGFASSGEPLGWKKGAGFQGGSQETTEAVFGHSWKIEGDGTTAWRGEIRQNAAKESWSGGLQIRANTAYKVRARVKRTDGLTSGSLIIDLRGGGVVEQGLSVNAATATEDWVEYEATLTDGIASVPDGLELVVAATGTLTDGESFYVDEIEIFEAAEPWHASTVFVSKAFQPEALDALDGLLQVARDDSHALRSVFSLNNLIYLVKERSIWVTEDDGVDEASQWNLRLVSPSVGTFSPKGVCVGEDWAIILSFDGVYLFNGTQPEPISDEIRPTWQSINWPQAHKSWVEADLVNKRIYIGIPTAAATEPDKVLMLDYTEGFGLEGFKAFQEGQAVTGSGRKWTVWTISANAGSLVRRENEKAQAMLFGGNGKIYELNRAATDDDGVAIDSYYRTGSVKASAAVLDFFGYLSAHVRGSGNLLVDLYKPNNSLEPVTPAYALSDPAAEDLERFLEFEADRASVRFRTNQVDHWFSLSKCVLWGRNHPMMPVRG